MRNITFTQTSYDSFIELQDKLHQNICRKRTLVAIGTHDLDTLKPPFTYEALKPEDIKFIALNQTQSMNARDLLKLYETNPEFKHLKPYVSIISDTSVYPVIYDSNRTVLSLPPIINGEHSKITLNTKNVFIECTATDYTKANIVLNTMVTMFSQYCSPSFKAETVKVVYEKGDMSWNGEALHKTITPNLSMKQFEVSVDYILDKIGQVNLNGEQIVRMLRKQQLDATLAKDKVLVYVPPTRSDILHACDIMEDVAISYGYNNIPRTNPKTSTIGKQQPLNSMGDLLRMELAMASYTEILSLILCSREENFAFLNRTDDGNSAVVLSNPKTVDFQVCRTSLLPGLLKTVERNVTAGLPLKLFEISDVVLLDSTSDIGARNERRLAAVYCSTTSGLENIHGLLDRIMEVLEIPFHKQSGYAIELSQDATYFPGRQASIYLKGKKIGSFGTLHPTVLERFGIKYPVSCIELELEPLI